MLRQVETSRRLYVVRDSVDICDEEFFLVVRSTNEKRMSLFAIPAIVLQDERREPSWGDQAPLARIIHIEVENLPSGPFDMLTAPLVGTWAEVPSSSRGFDSAPRVRGVAQG